MCLRPSVLVLFCMGRGFCESMLPSTETRVGNAPIESKIASTLLAASSCYYSSKKLASQRADVSLQEKASPQRQRRRIPAQDERAARQAPSSHRRRGSSRPQPAAAQYTTKNTKTGFGRITSENSKGGRGWRRALTRGGSVVARRRPRPEKRPLPGAGSIS